MNGTQAGLTAEGVAFIDVYVNGDSRTPTTTIVGPINLERFPNSALFRFAILNADGNRNNAVLCMPSNSKWSAVELRKVKGKTSGSRAVEIKINLPPGNREGFDSLRITLPFDGNDGRSMLFGQAVMWAWQEVSSLVDDV